MSKYISSTHHHHHHHNQLQCCLWDSYKYALYSKFREPTLYRYAAQGEWDRIPHRCQTHPREAQFVHKYAPMDTPLGRLLRTQSCSTCASDIQERIFEMKLAAVAALLDASVDAATCRDSFQRTPLHWACMDVDGNHRCGDITTTTTTTTEDSIILMLLERAPAAVHMMDLERRTPLHYLLARNGEIPLKLVTKLIALCPEALSIKDEVGETPIEIVESRRDEIKNVDDLIKSLRQLEAMFVTTSSSKREDSTRPDVL